MRESGYYPPGAEFDPDAPWNEIAIPEKDFDIVCSQTLSKTVTVSTNDYTPGASGVDYEPDDEGGYCASGWSDPDDTSDTNWNKAFSENEYHTPLQLIGILKEYLSKDLEKWEKEDKKNPHKMAASQVRKYKALIEECEGWEEDDIEFIQE